jgi:hypothetical protein
MEAPFHFGMTFSFWVGKIILLSQEIVTSINFIPKYIT